MRVYAIYARGRLPAPNDTPFISQSISQMGFIYSGSCLHGTTCRSVCEWLWLSYSLAVNQAKWKLTINVLDALEVISVTCVSAVCMVEAPDPKKSGMYLKSWL
jgi:hypothetical protein